MFDLFPQEQKKMISIFIFICVFQNIIYPYTEPQLIQAVPKVEIVVEFTEDTTFEYGTYVNPSSLIVSLENCTVRKYPQIDTTILGEQTLKYEFIDSYGTIHKKQIIIDIINQ